MASALGSEALSIASALIPVMIFVTTGISIIVLAGIHGPDRPGYKMLGRVFFNPLIIAALAGMGFRFFSIEPSVMLGNYLDMLGHSAIAICLLSLGARVGSIDLRAAALPLGLGIGAKLIAMPALAWALFAFLGIDDLFHTVGIVFAACPIAGNAPILAREMGGDADSIAAAVPATILGSAISMPVVLRLLT